MIIFYNFALYIYSIIVAAVSPFNIKAKQFTVGRKNLFYRLKKTIEGDNSSEIVWVHCASLGEFEQGRPLIEHIRSSYPNYKILVTFFSPSGYEIRKDYKGADYIFYLPIDTTRNARRFLDIVKPKAAIFIKYEFWINMLRELKRRNIKSYVVSAIFRPEQLFFKSYGGFYRDLLKNFTRIFVQNNNSKELLESIGITNVSVAGDTRYDRVAHIAESCPSNAIVERFATGGNRIFIAGSTWEPDDKIIAALAVSHRNLKFIIAPHELGEAKIEALCKTLSSNERLPLRYTKTDNTSDVESADVLIIDTIGILASIYKYGYCAFIGGGFGVGIHNTLEAATFGLPLAFGPNYLRFGEAVELVARGAATPVSSEEETNKWLDALINNDKQYQKSSKAASELVKENIGACKRILEHNLF